MPYYPFLTEQAILDLTKYTSREFFIKYVNYIPLYFCFYELCENPLEHSRDRVYYNEIVDKFRDTYSIEHITKVFDVATFNKINTFTYKQMMNNTYCDGLCGECESNEYWV